MKKVISKIKKINWLNILICFLLFFIFMSFIIFVFKDDLIIIKNYYFRMFILSLALCVSIDISRLALMLFNLIKNKVIKDENKN